MPKERAKSVEVHVYAYDLLRREIKQRYSPEGKKMFYSPLLPVGVGADVDLPVGSGIGNIRSQHSLSGNSLARVHLQQQKSTTRAAATLVSSVDRASSVPTTRDMTRPIRSWHIEDRLILLLSLSATRSSSTLSTLAAGRPPIGRLRRIPRRPRDILSSSVSSCDVSSTFDAIQPNPTLVVVSTPGLPPGLLSLINLLRFPSSSLALVREERRAHSRKIRRPRCSRIPLRSNTFLAVAPCHRISRNSHVLAESNP